MVVLFVPFLCLRNFWQRRRMTFSRRGPSAPAARREKHGGILIIAPQIASVWFVGLVLVFWRCFILKAPS